MTTLNPNTYDIKEGDLNSHLIYVENGLKGPPVLKDIQNEKIQTDEITKNVRKCLFVELNEGVSYFNLSTYYLVQFTYVMALFVTKVVIVKELNK